MTGRDESGGTKIDDDDWFSDEDSRPPTGADTAVEREPSWLEDEDVTRPAPQPTRASPVARRRLVALAVAVLVLIGVVVVALIAFAGGDSKKPTEPTTTTPPTTTTSPAATVPANPPPPTPPPSPSTPASTLPAGILRPGATGPEVKTVQRALASAGHSPGAIDGIYGPKTEQAVADFQRSAGIPADGHYGPQTKQALEQHITSG